MFENEPLLVMEDFQSQIAPQLIECNFAKKIVALQAHANPSVGEKLNIMIVGDPASGKSDLLVDVCDFTPNSGFCSKKVTPMGLLEKLEGCNGGITCLHPNTSIMIDTNLMKIGDIFDEKQKTRIGDVEFHPINFNVPSFNNFLIKYIKTNKISRKYYKGKLKHITFNSGFSIKLTPDHLLLDGDDLLWKKAEEFKEKDVVIAPLKLPENNKETYILDIMPDDWKIALQNKDRILLHNLIKNKSKSLINLMMKLKIKSNGFLRTR
ncbi:MAG: hypothetical protein AABY22_30760, partial [Nanoarchaeota archaeon]